MTKPTQTAPAVEWKPFYSVGDEYLDSQHREILSLVNWLYEAMESGQEEASVPLLARRLVDYTNKHFADEERKMRAVGFDGLERHVTLHKALAEKTQDFLYQCTKGEPPKARDLLMFVRQWWLNHIMEEDKRYAPNLYHLQSSADASVKELEAKIREELSNENTPESE